MSLLAEQIDRLCAGLRDIVAVSISARLPLGAGSNAVMHCEFFGEGGAGKTGRAFGHEIASVCPLGADGAPLPEYQSEPGRDSLAVAAGHVMWNLHVMALHRRTDPRIPHAFTARIGADGTVDLAYEVIETVPEAAHPLLDPAGATRPDDERTTSCP